MLKTQASLRVVVSLLMWTAVTVTALPVMGATAPGDANCDNTIDQRDLPALQLRIFGGGSFCSFADVNQDGRIGAADLTKLVEKLAVVPTPTATIASTEPPPTLTQTQPPPVTGTATRTIGTATRTTAPPVSTPTPTISVSVTKTPTDPGGTRTRTQTPSATRTGSVTPTGADTATPTIDTTVTPRLPTRTRTFTVTPIFTRTPTASVTPTRTRIDTRTPTAAGSATVTRTPSITRTPSVTRTASRTPTASNTRTASRTPTVTRTPSVTRTPTITRTPTRTRSMTPTQAPTNTRTPTRTRTPTIPPPDGPQLLFFGLRRADGRTLPVDDVTEAEDGTPVYITRIGSGFRIVAEVRRGRLGGNIDESGTMGFVLNDTRRAGLQIIVSMDLGFGAGRGSPAICDVPDPNVEGETLGGVPATLAFDGSQAVTDHINDMACRFDVHDGPGEACTINEHDNFAFVTTRTQKQFCSAPAIGIELTFPVGETYVIGQVADTSGRVGNQMKLIVRRPSQ